ncbi:hypothetical protein [Neobacillus terrae]|uniref:hypothetical protein n=1 Tax=Neobacillus terrae TaxID=3034837 RepID=UPI00140D2567|nr:hypothetical protein [Neobacillus terrae]NHM32038.1 hypothetical protein [Neobacillus terrae]
MAKFVKESNIRFGKLSIHLLLLTVILSFLTNVSVDILAIILGHPLEHNTSYATFPVLIWLFFALQSNKYKKKY